MIFYATADEADAYMFYRCVFVFCFFSVFFPSATKYETTVLGNDWTDFHETGKMEFPSPYPNGG